MDDAETTPAQRATTEDKPTRQKRLRPEIAIEPEASEPIVVFGNQDEDDKAGGPSNGGAGSRDDMSTLESSRKQLAEVHAELNEFAHLVGHDLRGPVRIARMLGDRLLAGSAADSEMSLEHVIDIGQRLDKTLARIDDMVISMVEYSDIPHDGATLVDVPLAPLTQTVADSIAAKLTEAGGTLEVDVAEGISAWADPDLLRRALVHLVTNSIKYRRPDCPLSISISATALDDHVEVRVKDNGPGIAAEDRERIFKPLERLHPHDNLGLGFGLAVCRRILASFQGEITAVGDEAVGTTMAISIPARDRQVAG